MATNELVAQPALAISDRTRHLGITAMRSANADRLRVFHALTVPEYIKLIGCTAVCRREDFYTISYSRAESGPFRILCSYEVCRRNRLLFTWKHDNALEGTSSLVKIRLEGDFEHTAVYVTHVGLEPSHQQWHQEP
jgi:uncharacterized protein YndB with AHSA1/START domain